MMLRKLRTKLANSIEYAYQDACQAGFAIHHAIHHATILAQELAHHLHMINQSSITRAGLPLCTAASFTVHLGLFSV